MKSNTRAALDNRSRQLNAQDVRYWQARGHDHVPSEAPKTSSPSTPGGSEAGKADSRGPR